ncbi:MAG: SDR family NAD(P)-dependent oxidoreductase [Betaproteobacteria bacterium]
MKVEGKTAVVTGAASGIGWATAQTLAQAGAAVVLADINAEAGERAAADLQARGARSVYLPLDVASDTSVREFAKAATAFTGQVDILVNGAGWGKIQPFMENTPEFWQRVVAVNFTGPVTLTHALLPGMIERHQGRIVNIASDAGRVGSLGETVYAGAKAGLIGFTKSLSREMARHGINVNCVCPGPTDTPLLAAVPEKHREAFQRAIPMKRFGQPSEIADAVLFFASDRSTYITGQVLSVSGGLTLVG